jgi:hypothetical protein
MTLGGGGLPLTSAGDDIAVMGGRRGGGVSKTVIAYFTCGYYGSYSG